MVSACAPPSRAGGDDSQTVDEVDEVDESENLPDMYGEAAATMVLQ